MAVQEPTPAEQRRYWDLQARKIGLWDLHQRAEQVREVHGANLPGEVLSLLDAIVEEYTRAEDAHQYFMFEHPNRSFRAFDPDHIEMAYDDEIEPLDLDKPSDAEEPEPR